MKRNEMIRKWTTFFDLIQINKAASMVAESARICGSVRLHGWMTSYLGRAWSLHKECDENNSPTHRK